MALKGEHRIRDVLQYAVLICLGRLVNSQRTACRFSGGTDLSPDGLSEKLVS
jgi:hypothetical protein